MNRNDIISLLQELSLIPGEYCILSGAVLVLRGIRRSGITGDLDILVTPRQMLALSRDYVFTQVRDDKFQITLAGRDIEVIVKDKQYWNTIYDMIDLLPMQDLRSIHASKFIRRKKSDVTDIEDIDSYLLSHPD